jgi:hypothetical protein
MYVKKIYFSLSTSYVYNIWNNYNNYFQTTIKFLSISLSNRCSKNTIVFLLSLTVFLYEDRFFLFIPIIVLKPGPVWRVDPGPGRSGAGTGPGWKKNRVRKNLVWPSKTRSKTWLQPVDFCFFLLKRRRFDFFKKRIDPTDPVTRLKPETQALNRAGSENYGSNK